MMTTLAAGATWTIWVKAFENVGDIGVEVFTLGIAVDGGRVRFTLGD